MKRTALVLATLLMAGTTTGSALAASGYARVQHRGPAAMAPDSIVRNQTIVAQALGLNLIINGSFEDNGGTNTTVFTGWTVLDQAGSSGSWFAQSGSGSPLNNFPVNPPTSGLYAAMADQTGPGSHLIYQDVTIPANGATLAFDLLVNNQAGSFYTPNTLDSFGSGSNQQFRVDLVDTAADPFDAGSGVYSNLYRTEVGSSRSFGYERVSVVIPGSGSPRDVRLRFAEVDNQSYFTVGVDNVTLTAIPTSANLRLGFSGPATSVRSGVAVPVYLRLDNYGPDPASSPLVEISSSAPAGSITITAPNGWVCVGQAVVRTAARSTLTFVPAPGSTFSCLYDGDLPRGATLFKLTTRPPANPPSGFVTFNATVSSLSEDKVPDNNSASFKLYVKPTAGFAPVVPGNH